MPTKHGVGGSSPSGETTFAACKTSWRFKADLAANDLHADNPNYWKGLNLLGFALMKVREELRVVA